jgi:hypothetical protein
MKGNPIKFKGHNTIVCCNLDSGEATLIKQVKNGYVISRPLGITDKEVSWLPNNWSVTRKMYLKSKNNSNQMKLINLP